MVLWANGMPPENKLVFQSDQVIYQEFRRASKFVLKQGRFYGFIGSF